MNLIIITGNLGQDAQEKSFQDGTKYWVLNIATTEKWKDKEGNKQEKTTWHRSQLTGKYDNLIPYLRKGQSVAIEGLQRHEQYDFKDTATGNTVDFNGKPIKMTMSFIRVRSIELLGSKNNSSEQPAAAATSASTTANTNVDTSPGEDDLPF